MSSGCNRHELKYESVKSLRNLCLYSFRMEKNVCGKGILLCCQTIYTLNISDKVSKKWMMINDGREYSGNVRRCSQNRLRRNCLISVFKGRDY